MSFFHNLLEKSQYLYRNEAFREITHAKVRINASKLLNFSKYQDGVLT